MTRKQKLANYQAIEDGEGLRMAYLLGTLGGGGKAIIIFLSLSNFSCFTSEAHHGSCHVFLIAEMIFCRWLVMLITGREQDESRRQNSREAKSLATKFGSGKKFYVAS